MNEGGWLYALGEGWLKAMVFGVIAAIGGWLVRKPIEQAGILGVITTAVEGQYTRFEREVRRLEEARNADAEDCDRQLTELRSEIDRLMQGPVAGYINPQNSRRDQ